LTIQDRANRVYKWWIALERNIQACFVVVGIVIFFVVAISQPIKRSPAYPKASLCKSALLAEKGIRAPSYYAPTGRMVVESGSDLLTFGCMVTRGEVRIRQIRLGQGGLIPGAWGKIHKWDTEKYLQQTGQK